MNLFRCPKCKGSLSEAAGFDCNHCGFKAPVRGGVPLFTDERYWGEVSAEELGDYIAAAEGAGFEKAKAEMFLRNQHFFNFSFDGSRADWRTCLSIQKDWRVLEIGAGMGAAAFALADVAAEVYAVDKSFLRAKWMQLRKQAEGKNNITALVADALELPFADQSFDLISGNGLLEWIGVTEKFTSPRAAQIHFLKEARRLLKPGGYLYVGIENRIGTPYWVGAKDHSGLAFTSLLPRRLADLYLHARAGRPYQTYTYSKSGYERLYREAGFQDVAFFLPLPGYNVPKYIFPYDDTRILAFGVKYLSSASTWKRKVLRRLASVPLVMRLWQRFFFSFLIFAQKV